MAKMIFHNDDGSVIETGSRNASPQTETDVMKRHTKHMENMLREVERMGGRVPAELAARVRYMKEEWG